MVHRDGTSTENDNLFIFQGIDNDNNEASPQGTENVYRPDTDNYNILDRRQDTTIHPPHHRGSENEDTTIHPPGNHEYTTRYSPENV